MMLSRASLRPVNRLRVELRVTYVTILRGEPRVTYTPATRPTPLCTNDLTLLAPAGKRRLSRKFNLLEIQPVK